MLYPEYATQMYELVAQGRARVVVSPQDISRITVENGDRVCVWEILPGPAIEQDNPRIEMLRH